MGFPSRLTPFRRRLVLAGAIAAALAIALVAVWSHGGRAAKRPTLAQLAATNYRTLTQRQSRVLLRFAQDEYDCLSAHGLDVTTPVASPTRITMEAPGHTAFALAQAMMGCEPKVGPPPLKSSLQARPHEILVYVPKRCLMNPHQLQGA